MVNGAGSETPRPWQKDWFLWVVLIALLSAVVGVVALSQNLTQVNSACARPAPPDAVSTRGRSGGVVPTVNDEKTPLLINFGTGRDPMNSFVLLTLSSPAPEGVQSLRVRLGPFRREDGRLLPPSSLVPSATIDPKGRRQLLELRLCVDPVSVDREEAHPGKYVGAVMIDDPRVAGGLASFTVHMKSSNMALVVAVAAVALVLGLFAAVVTAPGVTQGELATSPNRYKTLTCFSSGAAAVFMVFLAQYVRDPSWQGGMDLTLAFFVTCVTAAYGAGNFAGSFKLDRPASD